MPFVTLNDLLKDAAQRGYAVGSFNMVSFGFLNGILEAAEEEKSPVILSIAEVHLPHMKVEQFVPAAIQSAQAASVPVVIHLDHGLHFETVIRAIRWGFSSVMFDGSALSYEDNLVTTRLLARIAKAAGVSVEAELGKVGGAEGSEEKETTRREDYTDPDQAVEFVRETGIDALAIAIGNAHGFYQRKVELDFDLLERIRSKVTVPLVLHGGTGIPDEYFMRAIRLGITKVNYFTGVTQAAALRIKEFVRTDPKGYEWIALEAKKTIKEVVRERMRIFGSSGRG